MCCLWFSWSSCVFFCCVLLQTTGTRITNCASGSVEVVADTADFSLTCVEYTGTVQWRYTVSTQPDGFAVIGSCGSSCQLDREGLSRSFSLTQLSATSSRLGLKSTITSASLAYYLTYVCADSSCLVSIVVNAELSTPTLTVTTPATGSGWTVRGNVNITRVFSSAGQYSCVWEEKRPGSGSYTQIVNKAPTIDPPASGTSVRTGRCDFPDRTLSATAGTYTYRVTVSPGQTVKTDSSVVVETPATPSISCSPTGYVSEGGELTCTCSGDVGRPAGRLQLFRESTNTFTPGQYGDNTLPVTLTVNRADNGTKLRCDVDWITDITGPVITLRVATEARFVQLSLNGQSGTLELSTDQTTDVLFQCEASGIPAPDLVLTDGQRRELARLEGSTNRSVQHSVLRYSVSRARCEDSGTYTCTAENGVGNPVSTSSSLTVWCTMQVVADSFGSQVDELGTPVITAAGRGGKLHFELVTSETPNVVSFLYLGDVPSGLGQPPETGLFRLNCEETTVVYKTSCVIMASNVTEDTAGYYNVSMSASKGTTSFVFRLKLSVNVSTDKESEDGSEDGAVKCSCDGPDTKAWFGIWFAAGFGTMLAVDAGAVFLLWRRKWRLPCAGEEPVHKTTDDPAVRTEAPLAMSTIESDVATNDTGPYEDVRSEIRAVSEAPHTSHTSDTGPYEELKPIDMGLKSVYSAMSPPPHTSGTDEGYEIPAKDPAPAAASRI